MSECSWKGRAVISPHDKPVAGLAQIDMDETGQRIGAAKGRQLFTEGWDAPEMNAEVTRMFGAEQLTTCSVRRKASVAPVTTADCDEISYDALR